MSEGNVSKGSGSTPPTGRARSYTAYVALGSNLGDRERSLAEACRRIAALPEVSNVRASAVEETAPLGPVDQGAYLNQMVVLQTTLEPHALLRELQAIEQAGGRERAVRWGPRTIDLDIVLIDGVRCSDPDLVVPHPEIANRDFWRRELAELGAPGFSADAALQTTLSHPLR